MKTKNLVLRGAVNEKMKNKNKKNGSNNSQHTFEGGKQGVK